MFRLAPLLFALAGCNNSAGMTMPDLGGPPDLATGPFMTAPHTPFPQVSLHTTAVYPNAQLVTVTYAGFAFRKQAEDLADFLPTSQWITQVGAEYGVGAPVHLQKVELAATAPGSITDKQIIAFIKAQAGTTMPAPSATNSQLIYLMYFPGTTKINDGTGTLLCKNGYAGYHSFDSLNGVTFGYAVLPDCTGLLADLTSTVSHEVIEAATDPQDAWYLDVATDDHWLGLQGDEVADLCQDDDNVSEGGWALQRSWSNAAAAAGGPPCVPVPVSQIYENVTVSPETVATAKPGMSVSYTITGWSLVPTSDWPLLSAVSDMADFDPNVQLSAPTINNGKSVTVTLTVPAGTLPGSVGSVQIFSGATGGDFWPVTVLSN